MKIKGLLKLLSAFIISIAWNNSAQAGSINSGLGPLEIRPQFIVSQPFLAMTPENSSTLNRRRIQTVCRNRDRKYFCQHSGTD